MIKANKILKTTLTLLTITTILCGCSPTQKKAQTDEKYITQFSLDSRTVRYEDIAHTEPETNTENTDSEQEHEEEITLRDRLESIELVGEDTSKEYTIENKSDIVYNGITFKDLYKCIKQIDTKYDENTFINFIVKTYNSESNSNTVLAAVSIDKTEEYKAENGGENVDLPLDFELEENESYIALQNKYGERIKWQIILTDSDTFDTKFIYGCKSYIMVIDNGEDAVIDMSEFDSSK